MTHHITTKDIEAAIAEAATWAEQWGERHDLRPRERGGNQVEGAAIADGVLSRLLGIDESGLTAFIDEMTAPVLAEIIVRASMRSQGLTRYLIGTMGSIFLSGLTAGIMLGRKFPVS